MVYIRYATTKITQPGMLRIELQSGGLAKTEVRHHTLSLRIRMLLSYS
jgi:hypothetical protein